MFETPLLPGFAALPLESSREKGCSRGPVLSRREKWLGHRTLYIGQQVLKSLIRRRGGVVQAEMAYRQLKRQ